MRKSKKYFKRALASVLALSMALGTSTINWAEEEATTPVEKKDLVIYFANWDVYNIDYGQVKDLPWEKVTYINHAFWEIEPVADTENEYIIQSTDSWADIENGDTAHFTQYEEYSEQYPDVNIMLSIGGWTRCGYFSEMASTAEGRESFINSCIDTMNTYTWLDGIDVDWEYPGVERAPENDTDEGCPVVGDDYTNYTLLLKEMREAFDAEYGEGAKKLTTCSSVNVETIAEQDIAAIAKYVDLINIMSYDMTGSYDPVTGHQSALYTTGEDKHSVDKGVEYFLDAGVPASKINIGSPLYCHGWGSVVPDENGNVVGVAGSAEGYAGQVVWNILKAIELLVVEDGEIGWHKGYDEVAEAAYLYNDNPNSKYYQNYLTYEDEQSLEAKLDYIHEKDLAGMIVWENGGDSAVDEHPMITQMAIALGIYDGEQSVYGQAGQIPEVDDTVSAAGYPDPIYEVVAGDGSNTYAAGSYIYYNGAVWKSINDASSDWPANLPDGEWGASCWEKAFDVKQYVSQEELGYWDWAALAGEYVFYDPDKDSVGGIYLATADTSNTANDAPDGIWGTNWEYITTVYAGEAASDTGMPESITEVVAGDGSNTYPKGTYIYYNNAIWKSINDASSDWPANLPDGEWGASCWTKEMDVKQYVSQEELGYWDWAALAGEYVFYNPDKDGTGDIYLATADTSNTANDAPDGIWGTNWEYVTTVTLSSTDEEVPVDMVFEPAIADELFNPYGDWTIYLGNWGGQTADVAVDPTNAAHIQIKPTASFWYDAWSLQAQHVITGLEANKEYTVSVDITTDVADGSFKTDITGDQVIDVTGDTQVITGTVTAGEDGTAKITFGFGWVGLGNVIDIANITATPVAGDEETTPSGEGETTTKAPETTTKAPETTTVAPTTKAPETTTVAPTTKAPETTTVDPATMKKPAKVKIKKVYAKKKAAKKVKIKFKKVKGATAYQVQIAKAKKFTKKTRLVNKKSVKKVTVKVTSKKLANKKKLYVRVRAYVVTSDGSKVYGKWSKVKKVKIK